MIIALAMIVFAIIILAVYNMHSKLNTLFIMLMTGMFMILLGLVMYITKTSYYNGIFNLEIFIYKCMGKIRLNITPIKILMTIGYCTIFMADMIIFWENSDCSVLAKKFIAVCSLIFAASFLLLNIPAVSETIYIRFCDNNTYSQMVLLNKIFTGANNLIIIYFLFLPVPSLIFGIKNTELLFKKRHNTVVILVLIFENVIILIVTFFSKIQNLLNVFTMYMFDNVADKFEKFTALLPICVIAVLVILLVGSIKFDIFDSVDFFRVRVITKRMKVFLMDLKYIFHDFKNTMLTIIALKSVAVEKYGTDEGMAALNKIEDAAYDYAEKVEGLLNIYKAKKIVFEKINVFDCVRKSILRIETDFPICVEDVFEAPIINGDSYQLETLFFNILTNSAESIRAKKISDGVIIVRFIDEGNWCCVEIYDNGEGMSRKERRRIWSPFLSTKNTFLNWGIGLNQAKNIIEAHLGHICLKSKKDKFTLIQICFPKTV